MSKLCLEGGKTVWVIPGKNCPQCGTPCGKTIATNLLPVAVFTTVFIAALSTILMGVNMGQFSLDLLLDF